MSNPDFTLFDCIKETTNKTGTVASYPLLGAMSNFRAFSAKYVNGDKVRIKVDDHAGNWEIVEGTLASGAPWLFTRTAVVESTNGGAAVNWAAGVKEVFVPLTAKHWAEMKAALALAGSRRALTGSRSYYVSTTGNDSHDGLTTGTAFLTFARAVAELDTVDFKTGAIVSINFSGAFTENIDFKPLVGNGYVALYGNTSSDSSINGSITFTGPGEFHYGYFTQLGNYSQIAVYGGAKVYQSSDFVKGMAMDNGFYIQDFSQLKLSSMVCNATGIANYWVYATNYSLVDMTGISIDFTNNPAPNSGFVFLDTKSILNATGMTFTGSPTGNQYDVYGDSLYLKTDAGTNPVLGTAGGTTATGGQEFLA